MRGKKRNKKWFCPHPLGHGNQRRISYPNHGGSVFFTPFGVDRWRCHSNVTSLLLCNNDESVNGRVSWPSFLTCLSGRIVFPDAAAIGTEPPAFLVLLTARSCRVGWFFNTTALYIIIIIIIIILIIIIQFIQTYDTITQRNQQQ
jgi:hypothetical protein